MKPSKNVFRLAGRISKGLKAMVAVCVIAIFLINVSVAQNTPTILIDGTPVMASNVASAPYWLKAGQALAIANFTKFISVMQFNINGNALEFDQVVSVTTVQTVPVTKAWKIESVALDPTASPIMQGIPGSAGATGATGPAGPAGPAGSSGYSCNTVFDDDPGGPGTIDDNTTCFAHTWEINCSIVINSISTRVTAVSTAGTFKIGIYSIAGQKLVEGTSSTISGIGTVSVPISSYSLSPGLYYIAIVTVGSTSVDVMRNNGVDPNYFPYPAGRPKPRVAFTVTAGTLPTSFNPATVGIDSRAFHFRLDN